MISFAVGLVTGALSAVVVLTWDVHAVRRVRRQRQEAERAWLETTQEELAFRRGVVTDDLIRQLVERGARILEEERGGGGR